MNTGKSKSIDTTITAENRRPRTPGLRGLPTVSSRAKSDHNVTISMKPSLQKNKDFQNVTLLAIGNSCTPVSLGDLECSIAYNNYLQALKFQKITKDHLNVYEGILDDQLSQQADSLDEQIKEHAKISNNIKNIETQLKIEKLLEDLQEYAEKFEKLFNSNRLQDKLDNLLSYCADLCNRLYLVNVKPLKTQEDYDKFASLMEVCVTLLKKTMISCGDIEQTQILSDCLSNIMGLTEDVIKKDEVAAEKAMQVSIDGLKTLSDKFAELQIKNNNKSSQLF